MSEPTSVPHLGFQSQCEASSPSNHESLLTIQRGIVIQLTTAKNENEWVQLEEQMSLPYKDTACSLEGKNPEELQDLTSPASISQCLPPRSQASLSETYSPCGSKPTVNLVKSLSTEIESRDASSTLKARPLLSLVKSISTEISRHEPEVTQSKSDSRLNLHLWKQLTQPKARNGDSRTAPPSPSISPSESRGPFFKVPEVEAKLEDTRRKLSEAMQEPLSRLSKIIGDETSGTFRPRANSAGSAKTGAHGVELACDRLPTYEMPAIPKKKCQGKQSSSSDSSSHYEICTYGDILQVVEIEPVLESARIMPEISSKVSLNSHKSVPTRLLFYIALLTYGYLVLPVPPYASGLCFGLVAGFLLGLSVIFLMVPRSSANRNVPSTPECSLHESPLQDPDVLKGWLNEMYTYDPEFYHPSLMHSVYARLEGSTLRLSYPKYNIPRSVTYEDLPPDVPLVSHRVVQLAESKVFLVPPGLAHKRTWNKKYPICILLAKPAESGLCSPPEEDSEELPIPQEPSRKARIPTANPPDNVLYLFGRTGRDKEEWFQQLIFASQMLADDKGSPVRRGSKCAIPLNRCSSPSASLMCSGGSSRGSTEDIPSLCRARDLAGDVRKKILLDYHTYMAHFIQGEPSSPLLSPCHSAAGSPTAKRKFLSAVPAGTGEAQHSWINALLGRIFWDFLREKYWADQVAHKIQKKLSKIRLPYFMNELTLTDLDLGTSVPHILNASRPSMNSRGLWVDLEVTYTGSLQMTLETKMNLCKLGKESTWDGSQELELGQERAKGRTILLADSDEESSSAGSSEDEEVLPTELHGNQGEKIVPTGTDGYSFRIPPRLELKVRPKLGEREVTFTHVTEWIENKLQQELQKVFVMPNMDDLHLPIMCSSLEYLDQLPEDFQGTAEDDTESTAK
uniref:Testis expressed 2, like n=1 Tax=Erpetoichthys calabaricus TaxID=27687 RepID=A0A8C4SG19_ERPCA